MKRGWVADTTFKSLAVAGVALLLALAGVSWLAISTSEQLLFPELTQKARAEAEQVGRKVDYALTLGIPPDRLAGLDILFSGLKESDRDIAFLGLTDASDRLLHAHGIDAEGLLAALDRPDRRPMFEGLAAGQSLRADYLVTALPLRVGTLYLGHAEHALIQPLIDNLFDIGIVVLVAMLLAFEVMLLVLTLNISQPAQAAATALRAVAARRFDLVTGFGGPDELGTFLGRVDSVIAATANRLGTPFRSLRGPSLVGVRLLSFLFVFAEELARPFLPSYVDGFTQQMSDLGTGMATGIVIGLHMLIFASVMPVASMLYVRLGRRRLYIVGALVASAGLAGTGLAASYWDLLVWRALSAIGYATTFVACQGFVLELTNRDNRAQGAAMMVGGITLADICGPAVGGIVAERIGYSATLLMAAAVAALTVLAVRSLMGRDAAHAEVPGRITLRDFAVAFGNRPFAVQLLLAAIPAKFLLTGFLFYLVPVTLADLGSPEGDIGRVVMIYGLAMMVGSPLFARVSDRWQRHGLVVAIGGIVSAIGLIALPFVPATLLVVAVPVAVAALGFGQSMSITAQVSLVISLLPATDRQRGQSPGLTVLRFVERVGGGFGPVVAAALADSFGLVGSIGILGLYGTISFLLYATLVAYGRAAVGAAR
ncbi:MAG: MFS transporter [Rhodospirillales bacterium]|nr:MFS transporter [Rhodospirillales bacterium]